MLIAYQKYAVACSIGTVGGLAGRHPRGGGAMRPRFSSHRRFIRSSSSARRRALNPQQLQQATSRSAATAAGARRRGRGVRRWPRLS